MYDACVQAHIQAGKPWIPLSEGYLIIDEVKVAAKPHWNSRNDSLVGQSMTPEEMATLQDLYLVLGDDQSTEKTDYVLQTLWRDQSSHCDIVGPYYTSMGTLKAKFIAACVFDALRHFHSFQFQGDVAYLGWSKLKSDYAETSPWSSGSIWPPLYRR